VEHVADVRSYVEGRFVIIVGDMELAEELRVGHATVAEVICLTVQNATILNQPMSQPNWLEYWQTT